MTQEPLPTRPLATPTMVKTLLFLTGILSLFSILFFPIALHLHLPPFFPLSIAGIKSYFLWQFFSCPFLLPNHTLSGGFVLHLTFNLYLLWVCSSSLIEHRGKKSFLRFLLSSSLITTLCATVMLFVTNSSLLYAGNSAMVYTLLIGWMMLNPNSKISFSLTFTLKTKWLILSLIGFNLFTLITHGELLYFTSYFFSALYAYLYTLFFWQGKSDLDFLTKIEKRARHYSFRKRFKTKKFHEAKLFDFKTGEPLLDDNAFMDAMLARISLYGEEILTKEERLRMKKISSEKKQD